MSLLLDPPRAGGRLAHAWEGDDRVRPLDERGRRQAEALVDALAEFQIDRIVSSPYLAASRPSSRWPRRAGSRSSSTSSSERDRLHDVPEVLERAARARTRPSARTAICRGSATGSSRRARPGSSTASSSPAATSSRPPRRPGPRRATRARRLRGGPRARPRAARRAAAAPRRARRLRPGLSARARQGSRYCSAMLGRGRGAKRRLGLCELLRPERPPDELSQRARGSARGDGAARKRRREARERPLDARDGRASSSLAPRRVVDEEAAARACSEPMSSVAEPDGPCGRSRTRAGSSRRRRRTTRDARRRRREASRRPRRMQARPSSSALSASHRQPRRRGDRRRRARPRSRSAAPGAVTSTSTRAAPALAASRA